jgi:hypothetical protein
VRNDEAIQNGSYSGVSGGDDHHFDGLRGEQRDLQLLEVQSVQFPEEGVRLTA